MADLMTDTYTYSDLANRYGNFQVPSFKVKVDGNEVLPKDGANVSSMEITLSLEYAGCVAIHITGAYNGKNRSFLSSVKTALALGKTTEVELGYLSSCTKVFKGYVSSVSLTVDQVPGMDVTLMDVRKLMMDSRHKERYFDDVNYSDMVAKVMDDYSGLCTLEQESSNDELTRKIYQKGSDYEFLAKELARKLNKEFLVLSDKAYFRSPGGTASEMLTLEYGLSLISFTRQSDYLDLKVIAAGYDRAGQARIQRELMAKNADVSNTVLSTPANEIVVSDDAQSVEELTAMGEQVVRSKVSKAMTGSGKCIGLPEIVPGRYLKINKADGDVDGKYYVTEVRHSIGEHGFLTEFRTQGME